MRMPRLVPGWVAVMALAAVAAVAVVRSGRPGPGDRAPDSRMVPDAPEVPAPGGDETADVRRGAGGRVSRDWPRIPGEPVDDVWARLRRCEAGGRYDLDRGNGFYGAYQFTAATWHGLGYEGLPHEAPPAVQDEAARRLKARIGWSPWPACSRRIGVR